ncbi:alpha-E domain-containing protein [Haliea sp. E17]|uniref:alpha-E domain-containing protein n=1 Tax=Haliea sp. E17 TaxID=3401576 RepID=UPI003AAA7BE1
MTMLSRVAERLFWMARYLERAEDTARLTQAYTHLVMDIPEGSEPGWDILVNILDAAPMYTSRFRVYSEQNVLRFLIADPDNSSSIHHSIVAARENVRTTRDVLPEEAWEHVNELYHYSRETSESSIGRRNRHAFLEQVYTRCQMINGLIISTLCRDHAYRFIKLGHLLERADMTTRVIDVGAGALLGEENAKSPVTPLVWASLLRSLSAMGTYRRTIGPLIEADAVVDFMFCEASLPRSVKFCLDGIRKELTPLHNNKEALRVLESSRRKLTRFNADETQPEKLHQFIDRLQLNLNTLSDSICETWFPPPQG